MQIPSQLGKYARIGGSLGALLGISFGSGLFLGSGRSSYVIMGVTFGAMLLCFGVFYLLYRFWKRSKGNALAKLLRNDGGSTKIEGLESLRGNFEEGVDKLRKAGKNVYELPWFLLAGQAGAGKTEAIRRSHAKEDFPPGLNDLMQGVGGTLNMNWWFANKAIILDTAGRIFEEKVKAGQSNEWLEFLKMLKKARKNMPINGFILTIPADSLIRDSIHDIEKKASHIAEQLTIVQNTLGVRFPVFVLITKTDFVPGFREFVENVREPRLQQQILGWSNPKGLDDPFAPEQVDEYLSGVIEKLKKRRLTYMLDPHPVNDGKRLDELDALFTFPHHLREAFPNLRRYLEIVFALNPWTDRPLFIRGIYFTSSLQEGEALDEAIASVMGKDLGEMALSSFKKETPLFLRDMFFNKIYREYGLVTSAKRVGAAMRRRTVLFGLLSLLAMFAILGSAWFGGRSFQKQVGQESLYWQLAAEQLDDAENRTNGLKWKQPIVYAGMGGDKFVVESNQDYAFKLGSDQVDLAQYLYLLGEFADKELGVPAVFQPLRFFDRVFSGDRYDRKEAFRRVFETSVVYPILVNANEKLRDGGAMNKRKAGGLRAMIRLQALLNQPAEERGDGFSGAFFDELDALHQYLVDDPIKEPIREVYAQFYGKAYLAESGWPSGRYSNLYAPAESLEDPRLAGVKDGMRAWRESVQDIGREFQADITELKAHLSRFEKLGLEESAWLNNVQSEGWVQPDEIARLEQSFDSILAEVIREWSGDSDGFQLSEAFFRQAQAMDTRVESRVNAFSRDFDDLTEDPLITSLGSVVRKAKNEMEDIRRSVLTESLMQRAERVDTRILAPETGIKERIGLYRKVEEQLGELRAVQLPHYQGAGEAIASANLAYAESQEAIKQYKGYQSEKIRSVFGAMAEKVLSDKRDFFAGAYLSSALSSLRLKLGFPVVRDSDKTLQREEVFETADFAARLSEQTKMFLSRIEREGDERYDTLLSDLNEIERFVVDHFDPEVFKSMINVGLPPVTSLDRSRGLYSILQNARFVRDSKAKIHRFGLKPVRIDVLPLDGREIQMDFQSVLDGRPGDAGVLREIGDWVPLKLILSGDGIRRDIAPAPGQGKRYLVRRTIRSKHYGSPREVVFSLTLPKELPDPDGWLTLADLSSLRP